MLVPLSMGRLIRGVVPHGAVNGMEIPPVGIPVPACCRSNWIMFNPARKFSLMSDPCATTWFDCDASWNAITAAYSRIRVTPMAIINSIRVKPAIFFFGWIFIVGLMRNWK